MPIGAPKTLTQCRAFFAEPATPRQRQYEALRAYFVEERPSHDVARDFGYTAASFRVLCHHFRRDPDPQYFAAPRPGPRTQPKKSAARERAVALRKKNHSVYEISELLKVAGTPLSATAVREVLRAEGFAALPRRMDDERPDQPRPSVEPVADVRELDLSPRSFSTRCGGLFLFLGDLVRLSVDKIAADASLPGSKMIPAAHALRSCLALKLWSIEHKSHVMALAADEGLALFSGLNATPKRSYLSEYSGRVAPEQTRRILADWNNAVRPAGMLAGKSFNLDFHSVPFHGEDALVERHYVAMRSRKQKAVLAFLAQDADDRAFCYSNADLRKGEESAEVMRFVEFWKSTRGELPRHIVFDSRLTTYAHLAELDDLGITFMTLRRRSPKIRIEVAGLAPSAWRRVKLDVPTRKYQTPRVFEQTVRIAGKDLRQMYIRDLGHEEATVLLTNDRTTPPKKIITRYAQRMLIENALSDAVRFFHMDALSSAVGMKVDFDMALLVVASGLYRLLARRMRGYADAQARQVFRDLLDVPADVEIADGTVTVRLHRRAHLPILLASGAMAQPVAVPWWNGAKLQLASR